MYYLVERYAGARSGISVSAAWSLIWNSLYNPFKLSLQSPPTIVMNPPYLYHGEEGGLKTHPERSKWSRKLYPHEIHTLLWHTESAEHSMIFYSVLVNGYQQRHHPRKDRIDSRSIPVCQFNVVRGTPLWSLNFYALAECGAGLGCHKFATRLSTPTHQVTYPVPSCHSWVSTITAR